MLVINKEEKWIGFRLNRLGIRVWTDKCQLVAFTGKEWITIGSSRNLPLRVPNNAEELISVADDPLLLTAYQYMAQYSGSDLAGLLSKEKDFDTALSDP